MRPPEGVVVITQSLAFAGPVRPGIWDWNARENCGDCRRDHEEEAVDYRALAQESHFRVWEDVHEEAEYSHFGKDDSWDVGDLGHPRVLVLLAMLKIHYCLLTLTAFVIWVGVNVHTSFPIPELITVQLVESNQLSKRHTEKLKYVHRQRRDKCEHSA